MDESKKLGSRANGLLHVTDQARNASSQVVIAQDGIAGTSEEPRCRYRQE